MSTPGLFVVGLLVTLIVVAALALLVYAAVLDGRDDAARKAPPELPRIPETERDELMVA
ncbi:MAG: hypothetical protein ACJ780_23930 [Solirubrobacteraceae bacterium]